MIEPIDMNKVPPVVEEIGIGLQRIIDHLNTEKTLPFEACKECIEVSKAIGRKVVEKGEDEAFKALGKVVRTTNNEIIAITYEGKQYYPRELHPAIGVKKG